MNRPANPSRQISCADDYKVCPLCESLNAKQMRECWCCGWRGAFDVDSELVGQRLKAIEETAPHLLEFNVAEKKENWVSRLLRRLAGRFDTYA